jgi:nucleotide-binding universal stress UspA family protein
MKILLAIDDSKFSEDAVQMVIRHVRPEQAQICLLHVCEPVYSYVVSYSYAVHVQDVEAAQQKLLQQGRELVSRAEELLAKVGFRVETAVQNGDPRAVIIDYAATWKADLIVLGSHGRKGLDRLALGSVAEAVARHASCSVEIVRTPVKP